MTTRKHESMIPNQYNISRGETVGLRVPMGDMIKIREVEVVEVMGKVLKIRDDKRERTVRYNEIEKLEQAHEKPRQMPPEPPPIVRAAPVVVAPVAPVAAPAPVTTRAPSSDAMADFDTFLQMADDMLNGLSVHRAQILQRTKGMNEERAAIDQELDRLRIELEDVEKRIDATRQLKKI